MSWWEHEIPGLRWWATWISVIALMLVTLSFTVLGFVTFLERAFQ